MALAKEGAYEPSIASRAATDKPCETGTLDRMGQTITCGNSQCINSASDSEDHRLTARLSNNGLYSLPMSWVIPSEQLQCEDTIATSLAPLKQLVGQRLAIAIELHNAIFGTSIPLYTKVKCTRCDVGKHMFSVSA